MGIPTKRAREKVIPMDNGAAPQVKDAMAAFATTVDNEWALVTVGTEESGWNTMTIGWGSAGTLWSKPVANRFPFSIAAFVVSRRRR